MPPFPVAPFLPYRKDTVPRGVAPQAGPYHQPTYEVDRWPTLPGPCSPSKFSSCRFLRSDRVSMTPCITVAPRLRTVAIAFAPTLVSHDCSYVSEARSVPCPVPVRSRPDFSGIRRIPRRAASPCDDAAQAGRFPVDTFDVAIVSYFGIAAIHTVSFSRTDRCFALLVWCSFGHHRLRPPRGGRPNPASWIREGIISPIPCGFGEMTRIRLYSFGWVPLEQPVGESDGHPSSLRRSWPIGGESSLSGAEVLARVCRFDEIAFHRSSS
jgi:hypothetical protein